LAHLPNAAHIDWVLQSVKQNPALWNAAWNAALWNAAWDAAWDAARDAARDAAWDAARDAAWDVTRDAAWNAARDAAWYAAWYAARDVARALIAWDHAGPVLHMSDEAFAGALALDPHMVLLEPARHILKQEKK
jgi:hypothetical protein